MNSSNFTCLGYYWIKNIDFSLILEEVSLICRNMLFSVRYVYCLRYNHDSIGYNCTSDIFFELFRFLIHLELFIYVKR